MNITNTAELDDGCLAPQTAPARHDHPGTGATGLDAIVCSLLPHHEFAMTDASEIAAARRAGRRLGDALGFDEDLEARLGCIITEAATNMLKHAVHGHLFVTEVRSGSARGVEVVAIDGGPGISNLSRAMRDGVSSTGDAGNGLAAIRTLADEFDVYAPPGKGAAFFARVWRGERPRSMFASGALCNPIASEDECGDAWAITPRQDGLTMMAIDGLGHGPYAAEAARAALDRLAASPAMSPAGQIEACHQVLRKTAGAVLAMAHLDYGSNEIRFAGIGNISACISDGETWTQMASYDGVVGHSVRKVQEFVYPCPKGSLIIVHTDGVSNRWNPAAYPGLFACHPALIAAVLLRDFRRTADDAQVLVVRYTGLPGV